METNHEATTWSWLRSGGGSPRPLPFPISAFAGILATTPPSTTSPTGANGRGSKTASRTFRSKRTILGAKAGYYFGFHLQPLQDIYLDEPYVVSWDDGSSFAEGDFHIPVFGKGNARQVYFLGLIGLVLLLIACINFINLTTARSAIRAREVGVRKVVGAHRGQPTTLQAGTHEVVFEASGLPSGTYLVQLVTAQGSFVELIQLVK